MARNSERIRFLASLLRGHETVLDVGSDHGLVLREAIETHGVVKGIASDIREKPLMAARFNLQGLPVSFVQSDGFKAIDAPFDCAVIAGMGAYLIAEIMESAPMGRHITYILQANDKTEVLRKRLDLSGFMIVDEFVIHDGRYYVIIIVRRGKQPLSEEDLLLGPVLKNKPEALSFYRYKMGVLENIQKTADDQTSDRLHHIIGQYQSVIDRYA